MITNAYLLLFYYILTSIYGLHWSNNKNYHPSHRISMNENHNDNNISKNKFSLTSIQPYSQRIINPPINQVNQTEISFKSKFFIFFGC